MVSKKALLTKEGYVIRLTSFRDSDLMVSAIGEGGLFSFLARGAKKEGSKSSSSLVLLSYSEFSLSENGGGALSLCEAKPIRAIPWEDSLDLMASLSFLAEISSKLIGEEEAPSSFPWLKESIEALRKGFSPFTVDLILLAHFLVGQGYGLELDACVNCGKKTGIVGVSYDMGGFMCSDESEPSVKRYAPRSLNILRYIFKCSLSDVSRVAFGKEEALAILGDLGHYAEDATGVSLHSLPLLLKC